MTRWRIIATLFIAAGAAAGAEALWVGMKRRSLRLALPVVFALVALQVALVSHRIVRSTFNGPPPAPSVHGSQAAEFFHVPPRGDENPRHRPMLSPTRMNQGIVEGYEPLLGSEKARENLVRARGQAGYRGEAVAGGRQVSPSHWSPNHIIFEGVEDTLRLNLTPGSYWRVNGERPFAAMRILELTEPFVVGADVSGRVELRIVPTGWKLGIAATAAGALMTVLLALASVQRGGRQRETAGAGNEQADPSEKVVLKERTTQTRAREP
jgi:hypothetical protein